jgi:arylsulfatase A-like enzyme
MFVTRKPGIVNIFVNVMDLAPSFLDLAQLTYPVVFNNKKLDPMLGVSFVPYLEMKSNAIHSEDYIFGLEHNGQCLLIKGNWKITNISEPFDENAFALYNLSNDMAEAHDLSKTNPQKYREMLNEWVIFKKRVGVIPLEKGE